MTQHTVSLKFKKVNTFSMQSLSIVFTHQDVQRLLITINNYTIIIYNHVIII